MNQKTTQGKETTGQSRKPGLWHAEGHEVISLAFTIPGVDFERGFGPLNMFQMSSFSLENETGVSRCPPPDAVGHSQTRTLAKNLTSSWNNKAISGTLTRVCRVNSRGHEGRDMHKRKGKKMWQGWEEKKRFSVGAGGGHHCCVFNTLFDPGQR